MGKNNFDDLFTNMDIDEFIDEVNRLDKEMGVKLKHPNIFNEPEKLFEIGILNIQDRIVQLILLINQVDPDEYYGGVGTSQQEFTDYSQLNWRDEETRYYTDSLMYKARFLSGMMLDMMNKLDCICRNKYNQATRPPVGFYETQYLYLEEIFTYMKRLMTVMISGNDYHYILMKNFQLSMYAKKKTKTRKINRSVFEASEIIITGCQTNGIINPTRKEQDDILIYTIVRLAYMLSTGSCDFSDIPKFKEFEGMRVEHNLIDAIGYLGDAILEERKIRKKPIIAASFEDARPKIMTNYKVSNHDYGINYGMRALALVDFFCNDQKVSLFIEKMMNR